MRAIVPVDIIDSSLAPTDGSGSMWAALKSASYADNRLYSDPYGATFAYFSPTTAYSAGQSVVGVGKKGIYKKNATSSASSTAPESDPVNWTFIGSTYRWAMFDRSTSRSGLDSGSVTIGPFSSAGNINRIMILDCTINSIKIEGLRITVPGGVVTVQWTQNYTAPVDGIYFGTDGGIRCKIFELPGVGNTWDALGYHDCIRVTFNDGGYLSEMLFGYELDFGRTKKGYDVAITDYSKKSVDDYGGVTIVKRGFSSKMNISAYMANQDAAELCVKNLKRYRSQLLGWAGVDSRPSTFMLGYCKDWSMRADEKDQQILQLSIEGVV